MATVLLVGMLKTRETEPLVVRGLNVNHVSRERNSDSCDNCKVINLASIEREKESRFVLSWKWRNTFSRPIARKPAKMTRDKTLISGRMRRGQADSHIHTQRSSVLFDDVARALSAFFSNARNSSYAVLD